MGRNPVTTKRPASGKTATGPAVTGPVKKRAASTTTTTSKKAASNAPAPKRAKKTDTNARGPEAPAPKRSKKTDKNALGSGPPEPASPDSSSGKNVEEKKNVTIKNTTKKKQEEEKKKFAVIAERGAPGPKANIGWVHFGGWGEEIDSAYLDDSDFMDVVNEHKEVRVYIPAGEASAAPDPDAAPGGGQTLPGWGHYKTDYAGTAEDELDLDALAEKTEKAHNLFEELHGRFGDKILVSGYSMGFGFAVHVLATLPAHIKVMGFLGINGMIMAPTDKFLKNLPNRCKSFTVQWAMPRDEDNQAGDHFFRKWAQEATQDRFNAAGLGNQVIYLPQINESHGAPTRSLTMAHWLRFACANQAATPAKFDADKADVRRALAGMLGSDDFVAGFLARLGKSRTVGSALDEMGKSDEYVDDFMARLRAGSSGGAGAAGA
jgi:hypothetical protein